MLAVHCIPVFGSVVRSVLKDDSIDDGGNTVRVVVADGVEGGEN